MQIISPRVGGEQRSKKRIRVTIHCFCCTRAYEVCTNNGGGPAIVDEETAKLKTVEREMFGKNQELFTRWEHIEYRPHHYKTNSGGKAAKGKPEAIRQRSANMRPYIRFLFPPSYFHPPSTSTQALSLKGSTHPSYVTWSKNWCHRSDYDHQCCHTA